MARRYPRWLAALAALLLLTLLAPLAPAAEAQQSRLVWSAVQGVPEDVTLQSVFMLDPLTAWAAGRSRQGDRGYVYKLTLEANRWQVRLDGEFERALYGVVAWGSEQALVVGDRGFIARRDPTGGWSSEGPGAEAMIIRAVQLFDSGRAGWALGALNDQALGTSRAVALRYANGRWSEAAIQRPDGNSYVTSLHLAPGGGWAVGSHIWRLDGGGWRTEATPDFCADPSCALSLAGVRAIDGERAWAVGSRQASCGVCTAQSVIGARGPAGWGNSFPGQRVLDAAGAAPYGYDHNFLSGLYFVDAETGIAVGHRRYQLAGGDFSADAFALRYTGGAWRYEPLLLRTNSAPAAVFMADATRGLVVGDSGMLLSYGYGQQAPPPAPDGNPAAPVANPNQPGVAYFPETGHSLRGVFRSYWERNGGLERFGYPLTEEFPELSSEDGRTYTVQYFERARFEHHPELAGTQYEVLLGLLGHWVTADRKQEAAFLPSAPSPLPGGRYFPETQHTMAPEFVGYWERNGGLPIYGYPISEPFYELNAADGQRYLVQYFERNRFEYHPEQPDPRYRVLLGLLGGEYLRAKGWR